MLKNLMTKLLLGAALIPVQAMADDLPTLRVGWTIPNEEAKYTMMKRPEQFPELGKSYNIEWSQFQGTAPLVQAMLAGALDCSTQAPLSLALAASQAGLEASIVAEHAGEKNGHFSVYWAVLEDSPIKTVADLKDKTVGLNVYGSGVWGPLAIVLKRAGLDPESDVELVETGFPGSEEAIRSGKVDAGVFVQPFAARAEAKGGLRKLVSQSDALPDIPHIFEVCSKEAIETKPELVKAYIRDLTASMKIALSNRDQTLAVDSEVTRAPVAALDSYLLKDDDVFRDPDMAPSVDAIQGLFEIYAELGLVDSVLDVNDYINPDFVAPLK